VIAERLAHDGQAVRGFVRHLPDQNASRPRIEYFQGNALETDSILAALPGQDIVVNAIGSGTLKKNSVETDTTRAVLAALSRTRIRRYIAISSGMVAPVSFVFDRVIKPILFRNLYREHIERESLIRATALNWTIIRPSRLTDRPARGYVESTTARPDGPIAISRSDVADFISKVVAEDLYHRQAVFLVSR
jgi:putative NADH-flavin reductase